MAKRGRPPKIDRKKLLEDLLAYIAAEDVPILAEFAYRQGLHRQQLYEIAELSDAIKRCITKKEAQLERGLLSGDLVAAGAIFSLKQLGWSDNSKVEHQGIPAPPPATSPIFSITFPRGGPGVGSAPEDGVEVSDDAGAITSSGG